MEGHSTFRELRNVFVCIIEINVGLQRVKYGFPLTSFVYIPLWRHTVILIKRNETVVCGDRICILEPVGVSSYKWRRETDIIVKVDFLCDTCDDLCLNTLSRTQKYHTNTHLK